MNNNELQTQKINIKYVRYFNNLLIKLKGVPNNAFSHKLKLFAVVQLFPNTA